MAIESLLERGQLADWREFAQALGKSERLARDTLRVCEYVEDRASAALARVLVFSCHPEMRGRAPARQVPETTLDALSSPPTSTRSTQS
jgi:hypothetical protein